MQHVLAAVLQSALAQPLCISDEVFEEARENLFCLWLADAELALLTVPAVEDWLRAVLVGKHQQLLAQRGSHYPMQFYCWHDAQASQLRFSLVSAVVTLPFSCPLRLVELSVIVQGFLTQKHLLFDENLFEPDTTVGRLAAAQALTEEFILPVWRTIIL